MSALTDFDEWLEDNSRDVYDHGDLFVEVEDIKEYMRDKVVVSRALLKDIKEYMKSMFYDRISEQILYEKIKELYEHD